MTCDLYEISKREKEKGKEKGIYPPPLRILIDSFVTNYYMKI